MSFYTKEFRIDNPIYNSDHDQRVSDASQLWLHDTLVQECLRREATTLPLIALPHESFFNKTHFYIIGAGIFYRLSSQYKFTDVKTLSTPISHMRDKIFELESKNIDALFKLAFTTVLERSKEVFRWKVDLTLNEALLNTLTKHQIVLTV